jgi:RHS repeat-associated protein
MATGQTSLTYPDGSVVDHTFTPRNQVEDVKYTPYGGSATTLASSSYDGGMRTGTRVLGNGLTTTFAYRGAPGNAGDDQLASLTVETSPGAGNRPALSYTYSYDPNKNPTAENRGTAGSAADDYSFATTYDAKDRLTQWLRDNGDNQNWNLSLVGDWNTTAGSIDGTTINQSRTHNDVHEITVINASPLVHDVKGNLTRKAGDTYDRYTWDFDNKLKTADVDQDGNEDVSFTYDALGRRLSKNDGAMVTLYICDGQRVIEEYASTGSGFTLQRSYTHGTYYDDVLAKIEDNAGSPTRAYYHQDRQFNVRGMTDSAGTIVELYAYSPYGKQVILDAQGAVRAATNHDNYYGFTGRYLDAETGLWYFRARYFDTDLGRFTGRDPLRYPDGFNTYAGYFAMEGFVDPMGLDIPQEVDDMIMDIGVENIPLDVLGEVKMELESAYNEIAKLYDEKHGNPEGTSQGSWSGVEGYELNDYGVMVPNDGEGLVTTEDMAVEAQRIRPRHSQGYYYGAESHFFLGIGVVVVRCKDEKGCDKEMLFRKVCLGGAVGVSGGGGVVNMSGKRCDPSKYEGWFLEIGGSAGPFGGGVDVGYSDMPGTDKWRLPIPDSPNGTVEGGGGVGLGLLVKVTWCRYRFMGYNE